MGNKLATRKTIQDIVKRRKELATILTDAYDKLDEARKSAEEFDKRIARVIPLNLSGMSRDRAIRSLDVAFWSFVLNKTVWNYMTVKRRKAFEDACYWHAKGEDKLPEFTVDNIMSEIESIISARPADELIIDVMNYLRNSYDRGRYKTNKRNAFTLGEKVILSGALTIFMGHFSTTQFSSNYIASIDRVFHLLDGRGGIFDGLTPLQIAINDCKVGRGRDNERETDYFRVTCYKNGNLHLRFMRKDLLYQLNRIYASLIGESNKIPTTK